MDSSDVLLTLEDVALVLQVSPRSVRRAIAEQGLPCVTLSERCRRVRREDLDEWIRERAVFRPAGPRSIAEGRGPGRRVSAAQRGRLTVASEHAA